MAPIIPNYTTFKWWSFAVVAPYRSRGWAGGVVVLTLSLLLLWHFDDSQGIAGIRGAFGGGGTADLIASVYFCLSLFLVRFTLGDNPGGWRWYLLLVVGLLAAACLMASIVASVVFAPPFPMTLSLPYLILAGGLLGMYGKAIWNGPT